MTEIFKLLLDNIGWIFLFFVFFGGGLSEFLVRFRKARAQGKIQGLRRELEATRRERDMAQELLGKVSSGRPMPELEMVEYAATSARMARLLGLVQGADTAWPQLADDLREQIDDELRAYHTVPVPKALEGPKARGKGKR